MADVNISVSDNLGLNLGRWLGLKNAITDKITVEGDLYLKESDGSDSSIPVIDSSIQLQKDDDSYDLINLTEAVLTSLSVRIFTTDILDVLIQNVSSLKILISTSDSLDIISVENNGIPFIHDNKDIWSFTKEDGEWKLDKYKYEWIDIVEKYEWMFNQETEHWKNKEVPEIWVLTKRDDTWQK